MQSADFVSQSPAPRSHLPRAVMQTEGLTVRAIGDNPLIAGEPMPSSRWRIRLLSLYPPYLGAGVRVRPSADLRTFEVRMKLRWWNRNYVGTHFGGSLYSMCDPFLMLILMGALGRDYVVWDKAATIRFRKPGRTTLTATFRIDDAELDAIRAATAGGQPIDRTYNIDLVDGDGLVHASVEKVIYVRQRTG